MAFNVSSNSMEHPTELATENDVPPLEDMSELLNRIEIMKPTQQHKSQPKVKNNDSSRLSSHDSQQTKNQESKVDISSNQSEPSSFGGLKKGFLFGPPPNDKAKRKTDSIPTIKPTTKAEDKHRIQEVQDALKVGQQFADNQDWVTDDLLENVQKNEKLLTKLQNPYFMQAITEFQTNPQAGLAKYDGNVEMESFFKDFCGLLGQHFTKLADNSSENRSPSSTVIQTRKVEEVDIEVHNPHAEEDKKVKVLLADSEIRNILMDPDIQNLIEMLKSNPHEAQRILQRSNSDMKNKVSKLVERGVLQFQR